MAPKLSIVPSQMNPREASDELKLVEREISEKCEISLFVGISRWRDAPLHASVYADGRYPADLTFSVEGEDFRSLFAAIRAKWAEHSDEHGRRVVKSMALEIIRITDEMGECSDASLRAEKFTAGEVERYGDQACSKAAEMASKGPFFIVSLGGANRGEDAA